MKLEKEHVNKLKQLDRIEFYGKANWIKNNSDFYYHSLFFFIMGSLAIIISAIYNLSLLYSLIGLIAVLILPLVMLYKSIKEDNNKFNELNKEYFKIETK